MQKTKKVEIILTSTTTKQQQQQQQKMKNSFESLSENKQNILVKIRHLYGLNENVHDTLKAYLHVDESETQISLLDLQEALVEFVLKNTFLSSFKPYWKYRRAFLKLMISQVEELDEEVNETLFDSYIRIINGDDTNDEEKYFINFFTKVMSKSVTKNSTFAYTK